MKRIDTPMSAAQIMEMFNKKHDKFWEDYEFEEKATLIKTKSFDGPGWMVKAKKGDHVVVFIWEAKSSLTYDCKPVFVYDYVEEGVEFVNDGGRKGKVIKHNGEISILWE